MQRAARLVVVTSGASASLSINSSALSSVRNILRPSWSVEPPQSLWHRVPFQRESVRFPSPCHSRVPTLSHRNCTPCAWPRCTAQERKLIGVFILFNQRIRWHVPDVQKTNATGLFHNQPMPPHEAVIMLQCSLIASSYEHPSLPISSKAFSLAKVSTVVFFIVAFFSHSYYAAKLQIYFSYALTGLSNKLTSQRLYV